MLESRLRTCFAITYNFSFIMKGGCYVYSERSSRYAGGKPSYNTLLYKSESDAAFGRNKIGMRLFNDTDIEYLQVTIYLRNCGMPIQQIREYFSLADKGDSTIEERYKMLLIQQERLNEQLQQLTQSQTYIAHKLKIYSEYLHKNENIKNKTE